MVPPSGEGDRDPLARAPLEKSSQFENPNHRTIPLIDSNLILGSVRIGSTEVLGYIAPPVRQESTSAGIRVTVRSTCCKAALSLLEQLRGQFYLACVPCSASFRALFRTCPSGTRYASQP